MLGHLRDSTYLLRNNITLMKHTGLSMWYTKPWPCSGQHASLNYGARLISSKTIDGSNATAVVLGGFGFKERQMAKHASLYSQFNFNVVPVLSSVKQLTTPMVGEKRGRELAEKIQVMDQPVVIHAVSGAFWTMIYMLEYMDKSWRDQHVKAIVFDSCPPESNIYAFGGWMAFMLKRNYLKPYLCHIFHPYMFACGITDKWRQENDLKMFGEHAVIPRKANILFMHGRNDPVLNNEYVNKFVSDIRDNKQSENVSVIEKKFEKSRHAMSVIDYPDEYKRIHVDHLLITVPEWTKPLERQ